MYWRFSALHTATLECRARGPESGGLRFGKRLGRKKGQLVRCVETNLPHQDRSGKHNCRGRNTSCRVGTTHESGSVKLFLDDAKKYW